MPIRVCELYSSVQGEGLLTGTPSVFLRTSGCNLRCSFCDTPFASWAPEGEHKSVAELVEEVLRQSNRYVVITGGEPMIHPELAELCQQLHLRGRHITIETAGTVFQELHCDLMSISPKMSNSDPTIEQAGSWAARHSDRRMRPDIAGELIEQAATTDDGDYQLKFVVDSPNDLDEIIDWVGKIENVDLSRVLLMPQGVSIDELDRRADWLIPLCSKYGFRYCDRAHLRWYGNKRGT